MNDKARILVVDDEPKNLKLLEAYLFSWDYEPVLASNGSEALVKAFEEHIDLILLDIMMPDLDGFQVAKKLRADDKTRFIPIIFITALKETEDKLKGVESGCDDFISKPFNKNELNARIKNLLQLGFYRRMISENEKFETVIDNISDGLVICDPDWKIKYKNNAASKFLNLKDTENVNLADTIFGNYKVTMDIEKIIDSATDHKKFDLISKETLLEVSLDFIKNTRGELSDIVLTMREKEE